MKLDTALKMLRESPITFLSKNLLSITGSNVAGVVPYYFGYYNGFPQGVNEAFKFTPEYQELDQSAKGIDGVNRRMLNVHSLPMNRNGTELDLDNIKGLALGGDGPDIMITGLISACIIAVQQQVGEVIIGHIQPSGVRPTSDVLCQSIKDEGNFEGHGKASHVFGKSDYLTYANVVGVRTAGMWHVYAQCVAMPKGPVVKVVQIF